MKNKPLYYLIMSGLMGLLVVVTIAPSSGGYGGGGNSSFATNSGTAIVSQYDLSIMDTNSLRETIFNRSFVWTVDHYAYNLGGHGDMISNVPPYWVYYSSTGGYVWTNYSGLVVGSYGSGNRNVVFNFLNSSITDINIASDGLGNLTATSFSGNGSGLTFPLLFSTNEVACNSTNLTVFFTNNIPAGTFTYTNQTIHVRAVSTAELGSAGEDSPTIYFQFGNTTDAGTETEASSGAGYDALYDVTWTGGTNFYIEEKIDIRGGTFDTQYFYANANVSSTIPLSVLGQDTDVLSFTVPPTNGFVTVSK
jgi:hypothetical protein